MILNKNVRSFGKYTGLLNDDHSSASEYETTDRSSEESTTRLPIKTQQLTKTVSIIPRKVTKTKVFTTVPSKASVMIQPVEEEQLIANVRLFNCLFFLLNLFVSFSVI